MLCKYRIVYAAIFHFAKESAKELGAKFCCAHVSILNKNKIFIMIFKHLNWPKSQFQAYTYVASVSKMIYDYGLEHRHKIFETNFASCSIM